MNKRVLAADLGGTNLRMALVAEDGSVLHRVKRPTPNQKAAIVGAIVESARDCIRVGDVEVSTLGIAVAATINPADGILRNSPNMPFLDGISLAEPVSSELGLTVLTDNDATLAALGEYWLGASAGSQNSICVTLGTGVGGGLIFNGEIYHGIDGSAGEIGHICVEPDGVPCGCGSSGCLEKYASATAIVRIAGELSKVFPESPLNGLSKLTALDLFTAAKQSDELACEAFRTVARYLGIALGGLVNVLNPEIIVIAGGMSAAWELLADNVREELQKRAFREPAERVRLVPAKLGDDAGILGAARLAYLSRKFSAQQFV